jgi:hypothetical protein
MNILNDDDTIRFTKFRCLDSNSTYEVVQTRCVGRKRIDSIDTLVKNGGRRRDFYRKDLGVRFNNVEQLNVKYMISSGKIN